MNIWEITILKIIAAHAGTASLNHIYSELPKYIKLTPKHKIITYKTPSYHHQTRAHVDDLLDSRDLIRTDRGIYSITPRGRLRLDMR